MTIWSYSIFLILHFACIAMPLELDEDRQLTCICTNTHCRNTNRTTCHTLFKCYTQYLEKKDGSDPITRGCVQGNTPILCENRLPMPAITKSQGYKWPYLECCDSGDFCNNAESITPPSWYTTSSKSTRVDQINQSTETTTSRMSSYINSKIFALGVANTRTQGYQWPISKTVVLSVLFVGLFLLILILSFGFYILKIQSNYLRQLSQGYVRANEEESGNLPTASAPVCEMAVMSTESEKNNKRCEQT